MWTFGQKVAAGFAIALSLKPDGTLGGHISTPQGDVACKATRAKKS